MRHRVNAQECILRMQYLGVHIRVVQECEIWVCISLCESVRMHIVNAISGCAYFPAYCACNIWMSLCHQELNIWKCISLCESAGVNIVNAISGSAYPCSAGVHIVKSILCESIGVHIVNAISGSAYLCSACEVNIRISQCVIVKSISGSACLCVTAQECIL